MKRISEVNPPQPPSNLTSISAASMRASSDDAECPMCHGAGFLRMDAPVGHPNFGRLIPCECRLHELKERRQREFTEMSGLVMLEDWTFDEFDPGVPKVREAYERCIAFAQNPDGWLLLLGRYGCGKTHLAGAVANYVARYQRLFPLFAVVPDLLDHLRAAFAPDVSETYDSRFQQVRNADLLVLDDLGTENATPWANEKLFQIINYRYNQRKPTIITTNRDIDRLDPRIASRLKDAAICTGIYIEASDYRERRSQILRHR